MRFPVLWLALAYTAGLALFAGVDDSPRTLFLLATLALLLGAALLSVRLSRAEQARLRLGLACALAGFFFLGGATFGLSTAAVEARRIDRLLPAEEINLSEAVRLVGWLRRAPTQKPFATVYDLELESLETGGRRHSTSGGARLTYFFPLEPEPPAPPLPALRYGDRVEVLARMHPPATFRNPGSFDRKTFLARRGIFLEGTLRAPELLRQLPHTRGRAGLTWIYDLRVKLLAQLDRIVPPETRPHQNVVLRAMLLGDRSLLSHRLGDQFRLSGAYHVLVVSGLHLAVIAGFLFWLMRRLAINEWGTTLMTIGALVFYLLLVEDRPPVERAVWMVSLYLVARLLFREVHLANPLALAALLVLFLHPSWLFDASFHFSFGAVFLIAFLALPWIERTSSPYRDALGFLDAAERDDQLLTPRQVQLRYDLRALAELGCGLVFWAKEKEHAARRLLVRGVWIGLRAWEFFLLSFAIHLGFVLLTALYFQRVVWIGLLTNILVVPLVGLIVPVGLAALLLSLVWPLAGALAAWPASLLVSWLLFVVDKLGGQGVSYGIPSPPGGVILLYVGALVLLVVAVAHRRHQRWAGLALAALILVVVTHPFPPRTDETVLEITVLDVGQGDSLFLAFPDGETWLVDGGRGPVEIRTGYLVGAAVGETVVTPFLRSRGMKRLDRLWLTHAHHDHMAGLAAVLEEFSVGSFNVGPSPESQPYQELLAKVRARGIPIQEHGRGERFTVGDVEVEVLWPTGALDSHRLPSNNDSLVLRLCRGSTCVLLPGDIEADIEKELVQREMMLSAGVLKVPHHGGRNAASGEFMAAVAPMTAILSVGANNPFGHPFEEVLERLGAHAERVYRTDRDGSVTVRVGEDGLHVRSYREQKRAQPYPNLWAKLVACARRLLYLESN
ncbi:MAG: ComEC/Rec2 family competence protein [Terriglobia bacterium]